MRWLGSLSLKGAIVLGGAGGLESVAIDGIRPVVAVVAFVRALPAEDGVQLRSRGEPDVALLADQRAGEGSDDELGGGSRKLVT